MNKRHKNATILFIVLQLLLFKVGSSSTMTCPDFAHLVTTEGIQSEAPEGFFVYGIYGQNGIFISSIQQYSPQILPYARNDVPTDIAISSNGKWVLYNSNGVPYLIRLSPSCKVKVPISTATTSNVCFWRDQPNGQEAICYMVSPSVIRAIEVQFAGNSVAFGNDRIFVSLGDSLKIMPGNRLCVSSNQLFSAIHPLNNGSFSAWQTVYLTLPQNGQGVATGANMYKWANDTTIHRGGCAHAMSWNGALCAADVGIMSYSSCLPHAHKGFTITPFWYDTLAPQLMEQSIDEHAISINWCPERYRVGGAVEQNFWDWYFGNSNDYLIGNQRGDLADRHGIWLVRWNDNHWTFLTDPLAKIEAYQPAVHFCSMDTIQIDTAQVYDTAQMTDPNNPAYEVIYPNGGEVIWYGDTLRLKIASKMHGNVVIRLTTDGGRSWQDAFEKSVDPISDTLILIPLTTYTVTSDTSIQNEESLKTLLFTKCLIRIEDYGSGLYFDISDSYFTIQGRDYQSEKIPTNNSKGAGCGSGFFLALIPPLGIRARSRLHNRKKLK